MRQRRGARFRCVTLTLLVLGATSFPPVARSQQKPASGLKIIDILFEDYNGWPTPSFQMRAGGDVVLTFRVQGFERQLGKSESGLPEYRVSLQYEVELRDPQGVFVQPAGQGEIETILGTRDEQWTPKIRWTGSVPATAPTGNYQIQVRVNDRIAQQATGAKALFQVQGEAVRPTPTLEIQQVEFARSVNGPWFAERYFSPRDTIYVRYKIAGFRVSAERRIWVEQDWSVLDSEGRILVSQDNASVEKLEAFYPPRFLSTLFDVTLEDPKPGAYTLRIALRDRIGEQTASVESHFVLRP